MGGLPLHPAIVHIPIGLAVVLPLVALGVALALGRGALPRSAWTLVVGLQALLLASAFAALLSGEREGEQAEATVSESLVEHHEEAGEAMTWVGGAVLAIAGLALVLKERPARWLRLATVVGTVVVLVMAFQTGHSGGELVFVHGANVKAAPASPTPKTHHEGGER